MGEAAELHLMRLASFSGNSGLSQDTHSIRPRPSKNSRANPSTTRIHYRSCRTNRDRQHGSIQLDWCLLREYLRSFGRIGFHWPRGGPDNQRQQIPIALPWAAKCKSGLSGKPIAELASIEPTNLNHWMVIFTL